MTNTNSQRVVITGMGVVSPLGCEPDTLWENVAAGRSSIAPLKAVPGSALPIKHGSEANDFTGAIEDYGPLDNQLKRAIKKNMKVMCREIEMGVAAAQKALTHCNFPESERTPERCGVLFGCDYILTRPEEYADGVQSCRDEAGEFHIERWPTLGLPKVNPLWLLKYLPNMPNSHVAIYNDFRGPNNSLTVREASFGLSLAEAAAIIARGQADLMIVGATGTRIHPLRTMHTVLIEKLAADREDPSTTARPFSRDCDGGVIGEGAGALVIESLEHAERRGAKIHGEILGTGSAMVGPKGERDFLRQAVASAVGKSLNAAGCRLPAEFHIHAHGLSDPRADRSEAAGIADALKGIGRDMPVTAAKSYFGNLGAGSAVVEMILSLAAIRQGKLFPIRNLTEPVAEATWRAATASDSAGDAVAHISYTLQGQAASMVLGRGPN
ncbi:MAG: beta-ketoacyl synthase N-terminal-like domain-containing protein [Pirellulales bacterium]